MCHVSSETYMSVIRITVRRHRPVMSQSSERCVWRGRQDSWSIMHFTDWSKQRRFLIRINGSIYLLAIDSPMWLSSLKWLVVNR